MEGWIKSYRAILENPIVCKDADHYAVWGYLLHNAAHAPMSVVFKGIRITLKPGQLIVGRIKIAEFFKIDDSKVLRILKKFEREQQIEIEPSNLNSLISICNWGVYQNNEQQIEQQPNIDYTSIEQPLSNDQTTIAHLLNTIKELKNIKNIKNVNNNTHTEFLDFKDLTREQKFIDWLEREYPAIQQMPEPISETQASWIISKYSTDDIKRIIMAMDNKGVSKNKSAYATFSAFAGNDKILKERNDNKQKQYNYEQKCDLVLSLKYTESDFERLLVNGKAVYTLRPNVQ